MVGVGDGVCVALYVGVTDVVFVGEGVAEIVVVSEGVLVGEWVTWGVEKGVFVTVGVTTHVQSGQISVWQAPTFLIS